MYAQDRYYRHSGAVPPTGILLAAILGTPTALILGALYGYGVYHIPYIYLNLFLTLALGFLVGTMTGLGAQLGNLRNDTVVKGLGVILGLVALYANWVAWIYAASEQTILTFEPPAIVAILREAAIDGVWSIFDWFPTGPFLYGFWLLEAAAVLGVSVYAAWFRIGNVPFCERCRKWLDKPLTIGPLAPIFEIDRIRTSLEQGDARGLDELEPGLAEGGFYTDIELRQCPKCLQFHLLTVNSCKVTVDKKGKSSIKTEAIVRNLIVDSSMYEKLKRKSAVPGESEAPTAGPAGV
jgi:hypothetical protein